MKNKTKALIILFFSISILVSGAYLFLPFYFNSLDDRMRDFYFKIRGSQKVSDEIVIVDIDEKSIKELGQWPWERDKVATILYNLTKLDSTIIGLDIIFSEKDKTSPKNFADKFGIKNENLVDYDYLLAKSIAITPTILGFVFDFKNINNHEAPNIPSIFIQKHKIYDYIPEAKGVLSNLDIIQNASYSSGFINNIPDDNGMIRSVPLLITYDMQVYPSLVFEMYRIATGISSVLINYKEAGIDYIKLGNKIIRCDRFGKLYINFRGESKSYRYISAVDVYKNNVDKRLLENKFVLIGTSAYGLMDLRATPMDSVVPGVEIHANILDNLLNDDMLFKPSWIESFDIIMILLTSFCVIFILYRFNFIYMILIYSFLFVLEFFFTYYMLFDLHLIVNIIFPFISMILSLIGLLGIDYFFETKQKELIKRSFSKKVSKQVMEDLLKNPNRADLSSKEVELTVYFSDIRSFTTISENLKSPQKIVNFLNYYMNAMVNIIEKNGGTIDKFIGDAVMAYWNAPLKVENHADKALKSALKQIAMRDKLNKKINKKFGFNVDYGVGINSGNVVVGEVGSIGRSDYTIIGDAVNLASRLEGLCKVYKVRLIISEFTKDMLKDKYIFQLLDIVKVKGKHQSVKIYEVIDFEDKIDNNKKLELKEYSKAHKLYISADFVKASSIFKDLYSRYGKYLYKLYFIRCEELSKTDIENFDGSYKYTTK